MEERNRASGDREEIERLQKCVRVAEEKTRQVTQTYLEQRHGPRVAAAWQEKIEIARRTSVLYAAQEEAPLPWQVRPQRRGAGGPRVHRAVRREALAREEDLSVLNKYACAADVAARSRTWSRA